MDPCPFVRIVIRNLALKLPVGSKSSAFSCYCKIKLNNFPSQIASLPLFSIDDSNHVSSSSSAFFSLNKSQFDRLMISSSNNKKPFCLKIEIYKGHGTGKICGLNSGKLLGLVSLPLNLKGIEQSKGCCVVQNGWVLLSERAKGELAQLHLNVRAEPDPRFVFQFDGEPECSPQVFQVNGSVRQPVFTCKFSFRNSGDRNLRSRSSLSEETKSPISWLNLLKSNREEAAAKKERKGWCITIHDLSGSPVAAASMVTPFVPSPGTNRVSKSNPGAWLILHASDGTWKPWGRLEAWRESGDRLGHRFELLPNGDTGGVDAVTLVNSAVSFKNGGKFNIDIGNGSTPVDSPSSSFDLGSVSGSESGPGSWAEVMYEGFVMSSTVGRCGKAEVEVEVGVQHVTCAEDAAAFVALAAAMDLSVDACRVFSHKLRKELRQEGQDMVV